MTITYALTQYCTFWCHNCDHEWAPVCTDAIPNHPRQCPREKIVVCPKCGSQGVPEDRVAYITRMMRSKSE